jgi:hypothetical protein
MGERNHRFSNSRRTCSPVRSPFAYVGDLRSRARSAKVSICRMPKVDVLRPRRVPVHTHPSLQFFWGSQGNFWIIRCQLNGPKEFALARPSLSPGLTASLSHSIGAVLPCTTMR